MKSIGLISLLYITSGFHLAVCQPGKSAQRVNCTELSFALRNNSSSDFTPAGITRLKNRTIEIQRIVLSESIDLDTLTYLLQNHQRLQSIQDQNNRKVLRTTIKIPADLPLLLFVHVIARLDSIRHFVFDQRSNELLFLMLPQGDGRYRLLLSMPKVFAQHSQKGLIDFNGDTLIPPMYEHLEFKDGDIVMARKHNKWGVLSTRNEILIPFCYDYIYFNTKGRENGTLYVEENGKKGILKVTGEAIVPVVYDDMIGFYAEEVLYLYSKDQKWGWLSLEKELVPAKYKSVTNFYTRGASPVFLVESERGYEIRDLNDNLLGDPLGHLNRFVLHDNLLVAESTTGTGIIDIHGKVILPFVYTDISETHRSRFWYVSKNGKYGIFDAQAQKFAIPLLYDGRGEGYGSDLSDVFSFKVSEAKTGKFQYGIVNANNKTIVPFKYDSVNSHNGNFIVIQKNGNYGAVDSNGRKIAKLKYEYLGSTHGAAAQVYKLNGKYGYMYEDGQLMTEPLFDRPKVFGDSYTEITVLKDGKQFCLNTNGDFHAGKCDTD